MKDQGLNQSSAAATLVRARCSVRRTYFAISFEASGPTSWAATRTFPLSAERAARGFGQGQLSGVVWVASNYSGCPSCGDRGFFLCRRCQTANCTGSAVVVENQTTVICATCGPVGALGGVIETLTAFADI